MPTIELIALILTSTLVYSTPLILTSPGGTFSERSGVVDVGLEGIMVMDASSSIVSNLTMGPSLDSVTPWVAILVGGVIGVLFSLIHAVAAVSLRAGHIISGTVISLMAPASGVFLVKTWYGKGQTDNIMQSLGYFSLPELADIPVIGPIFFKSTFLPVYCATLIAVLAWVVISRTKFGLRFRSVGEDPQTTGTLGINIYAVHYSGVLASDLLGDMGGAVFAQSISGNFSTGMIVGQGSISMATMIFGKQSPLGAVGASLFSGLAQSLSTTGVQLPVISSIPPVLSQIAPYLLTIIVLVASLGEASSPKTNRKNYTKSRQPLGE